MVKAGLVATWMMVVGAGLIGLTWHASRPGDEGRSPGRWPIASRIPRDPGRPTLMVWLHPRCPCSRATVAELGRVVARSRGRASVRAVLVGPGRGDLAARASAIPGVEAWSDEGGDEADRFGVATSGQVQLFDASGRLVFGGGITGSRGHEGDNLGADLVAALISGPGAGGGATAPVFGCPMTREAGR